MIHRILLALLLIGLALPALAAPLGHAAAPERHAAMAMDHRDHHGSTPSIPALHGSKHECIGCIASFDRPHVAAPAFAPQPMLKSAAALDQPFARAGPDTPPPKS